MQVAVFGPNAEQAIRSAETKHSIELARQSGTPISLIGISSDASWGKSSTALVNAIYAQHVLGIIALDRNSSHLSEQLGLKSFTPVIALSSDKALTSTNIPWIFRMPSGTTLPDAITAFSAALRKGGPNSERIRDVLASGESVSGFHFQSTGEPAIATAEK